MRVSTVRLRAGVAASLDDLAMRTGGVRALAEAAEYDSPWHLRDVAQHGKARLSIETIARLVAAAHVTPTEWAAMVEGHVCRQPWQQKVVFLDDDDG